MKKTKKKLITAFIFMLMILAQFSFMPISPIQADDSLWNSQVGVSGGELENTFGEAQDPRVIVAKIIKVLLGFLGIIFIALLIFAGFKYMTAQGNDDQVKEAMTIIKNCVIGLIIVVAAYAITDFVMDCVMDIGSGSTIWMCK